MITNKKMNNDQNHRGRLVKNSDAVILRLKSGETYTSLAKEYGVTVPAVTYFAKKRGIAYHPETFAISEVSKAMLHEIARLTKLISEARSAQVQIDALTAALRVIAGEDRA